MSEMVFGIVLNKGVAMTLDAVPNGGFAWVTATIGFHENAKGGKGEGALCGRDGEGKLSEWD